MIFPAQQHTLRLGHTPTPTPSCPEYEIPLARLELCRPFARRQGRRARRPTHAQVDLARRPLPPYTTRAASGDASRRRSILGSLLAEKAKKPSLSSSYGSKNRKCFSSPPTRAITANRPLAGRQFCCAKLTPCGRNYDLSGTPSGTVAGSCSLCAVATPPT